MKNAYLIVPDLHYATVKEHRLDYLSEVLSCLTQILDIRNQYASRGYNVYLIFLGDVIDGPIQRSEDAMRCQNVFRYYASLFSGVYCVVGNHEINNSLSNPFWFLVSRIDDKALLEVGRPLQPQALDSVIQVPDMIQDGEVKFYFNHYGIAPKTPNNSKISIGLFHQDVGSNKICKMWGTFDDAEEASYLQEYNWSFFGHMHLASGRFFLNAQKTCIGEWLGTCVGTTVTEVEELSGECKIPVVIINDGQFVEVADEYIKRSVASKVIDYEKLKVTRATTALVRDVKFAADQVTHADTLISAIRTAATNANLGGLFELLTEGNEVVISSYRSGLEQIRVTTGTEEGAT